MQRGYRGRAGAARTRVAAALASGLLLVGVVAFSSPVTGAIAQRAPALGHANAYSTVPLVIGEPVAIAVAELKAARLGALIEASSSTGRVYRQSPAAGTQLVRGAVVSIWAGTPAPTVTTAATTTTTSPGRGGRPHVH